MFRRVPCIKFAVLALLLSCAPAPAAEKSPLDIYRSGNYEGAIAAGEAAGTGEGLAVAARAALADANLRETPCLPCLQRAEALARRSISLDTMHPEAFVYLAAALGYESRIVGVLRARFAGYPEQAKDAIDRALALTPEDSWTLAAAGAWQIEVVRNGGSLLARALYGARVDVGMDYFRRAIAADPGNLVIRFQYALSLSGYDFDQYKDEALGHLAASAKLEPRTAYESAIKERAGRLLALIKANHLADYLALVNRYQGYP
jgi:hypothetical protein